MPPLVPEDFDKNVFINCPFDQEYLSLLRPLLFTILYVGFNPKIGLESSDSGETRINKICELIRASRYSIHDLSRLQSSRRNEFYRMNMPFELGIEYGCRHFASDHLRRKRCLILEKSRHDYIKALSDLSGVDIKSHQNKPEKLIAAVRSWFIETVGLRNIESPTVIWYQFTDFTSDFYEKRKSQGFSDEDIEEMPVPEYMHFIQEWLRHQTQND
jgi:hypothetical protein